MSLDWIEGCDESESEPHAEKRRVAATSNSKNPSRFIV
jgi:hypothetical protein